MKRKLLLSLLGILAGLPILARDFEYTYEGQTIVYTVLDEESKTCETKAGTFINDWTYEGGNSVSGELILPSNPKDGDVEYTLTRIGSYSFAGCWELNSINIPDSVTEIGDDAFWIGYGGGIAGLESLTIGSGLKVLPNLGCFDQNNWEHFNDYVHLTFHEGLEKIEDNFCLFGITNKIDIIIDDIDQWAMTAPEGYSPTVPFCFQKWGDDPGDPVVTIYYRGKPLTEVALGAKAERINPYAFAYTEIDKVSFSSYLTEVGSKAFYSTNLTEVALPEGVVSVGDYSFSCCENLYDVSLPSTLQYIGEGAFSEDISLYEIVLPEKLGNISDYCFNGCIDLENITLNEGLQRIGSYAFNNCTRLNLPTFPESLVEIGDYAFFGKIYTGDLKFGSKLKTIGSYSFSENKEGDSYDYDNGDMTEWHNPVTDCVLTITLPEGLQSIGDFAFRWQPIREIKFPATLENIGVGGFFGTMIYSLDIPSSVTEISDYAFSTMPNLTKVRIPEGLTRIGDYAFSYSPVGKLDFPSTLTSIGTGAFYASSLINCKIPEGVTSIGNRAFYNSGLNNCSVPNSVTEIGEKVFSEINYVTLGSGTKSLSNQIAENISVLEMMSVNPPTLTNNRLGFTPDIVIVPEGAGDTYKKNNRWKDYNISARNSNKATVYVSDPGTLATEIRVQTGIMPALVTNLVVEGTINDDDFAVMRSNMTSCYEINMSGLTNKSIPANAFAGKNTLLELTLPSGTEEIGEQAFNGCSVLHLTAIPSKLSTIGVGAFSGCSSMDLSIKFPATLKTLGEGAFEGCRSIVSADFSACSDLNFGTRVFSGCRSLEWANLPEGMTSLPSGTFSDAGLLSVTLPSTLETIEEGAFYGSGLQTVEIPEGVTRIGKNAFSNTVSLQTVTFPATLEYIGDWAFAYSGISGAYLPSSLSELGYGAFSTSSLSYVTFNSVISEIPAYAFAGCPYLMFANLPNTLKAINENSFATPALAAISSPTVDPAATFGAPFTGVNNYTCSLSIPKPSYSKYLQAEYWGAFVDIRNCIDVAIPENLEVVYMNEEDYQDIIEVMEEENPSEHPADVRRRALRAMARDSKQDFSKFAARLFNNASLYAEDKAQIRYFIPNLPEAVDDLVIKYNGKEITSQLDKETMSFVCPPLTSSSTLVIESQKLAGVETVACEGEISVDTPVFDLTGVVVGHGPEALKNLPAGIYIVAGKKMVVK